MRVLTNFKQPFGQFSSIFLSKIENFVFLSMMLIFAVLFIFCPKLISWVVRYVLF